MKGQHNRQISAVDELVKKLKQGPISNIPLPELVKYGKYAYRIVDELNISRVQLRRIYSELKHILKAKKITDDNMAKLYMLYPILAYQKERGVVSGKFVNLMYALLENIERYHDEKNLEIAEKFLTALVAYARKEQGR